MTVSSAEEFWGTGAKADQPAGKVPSADEFWGKPAETKPVAKARGLADMLPDYSRPPVGKVSDDMGAAMGAPAPKRESVLQNTVVPQGPQTLEQTGGAPYSRNTVAQTTQTLASMQDEPRARAANLPGPEGALVRAINPGLKETAASKALGGNTVKTRALFYVEQGLDAEGAIAQAQRDFQSGAPAKRLDQIKNTDAVTAAGQDLRNAGFAKRVGAQAAAGLAEGYGGAMRVAGDLTGIDAVSNTGKKLATGAGEFTQGMGEAPRVEGFAPDSVVQYGAKMAENATSSLAQSAALAAVFGPGALIPLMSLQSGGQKYNEARNAGLEPAVALANAVPTGIFEAVGEKFSGLDKAASALGTILSRGATDAAKRIAAGELIKAGVKEVPGEVVTYLGQTGVDLLPGIGINPNLTMDQFINGLRDTVVTASMMGGGLGVAGAAANLRKKAENAGMSAAFADIAPAMGIPDSAVAAVIQKTEGMDPEKVPGYIERFTNALAARGVIKPSEIPGAVMVKLHEARAAVGKMLPKAPVSGENQDQALASTAPSATETVATAPAESDAIDAAELVEPDQTIELTPTTENSFSESGVRKPKTFSDAIHTVSSSQESLNLGNVVDVFSTSVSADNSSLGKSRIESKSGDADQLTDRFSVNTITEQLDRLFDVPPGNNGALNAAISHSARDSFSADAKLFGDSVLAQSLRSKGFDSLSTDQKAVVQNRVLSWADDLQILNTIVQLVPVDVVNMLIPGQASSNSGRNNKTVLLKRLLDSASLNDPVFVGRLVDTVAARLPVAFAARVAEKIGAPLKPPRVSDQSGSTLGAGDSIHGKNISTNTSDGDNNTKAADVSASPEVSPMDSGATGTGGTGTTVSLDAGMGTGATPEPAVDAGGLRDQSADVPVSLGATDEGAVKQESGRVGRDGIDLADGGKPFKTKREADRARKMHPDMRVVSHKDGKKTGYVLVAKTPAQIAAQAKAAKRLGGASPKGEPIHAHGFIAGEGGVSKAAMADMGFDRNVRVGAKWLFAADGKGLTLAQAAEKLFEAGYIKSESESDAADVLKRSTSQPQYTAEGWDRLAEAEHAARFEDHLAAQQDMAEADDFDPFESLADDGFDPDDIEGTGYSEAEDPIKLEVNALLSQAQALGIDTETITEAAYEQTRNGSEQDYYEAARDALQAAIQGSNGDSGQDSGETSQAGSRSEVAADGTLTIQGDAAEIKSELIDAGIPAAAIMPSRDGVVVGKSQAEAAQAALDTPEPVKPRTLNEEGRASDGKPINAGDVFATLSGRETTPYPKQKGQKYASQWLIDNAIAEAKSRGDNFNVTVFGGEKPGRDGELPAASRDSMLMYLFGEQPAVVPGILKPLTDRAEPEPGLTAPTREDVLASQERAAAAEKSTKAQKKADEERARLEQERKDIAARSAAAADTFELGGDAEANLSGQVDIFSQPAEEKEDQAPAAIAPEATKPVAKPKADQAETIELRKRVSVLKSLRECLTS